MINCQTVQSRRHELVTEFAYLEIQMTESELSRSKRVRRRTLYEKTEQPINWKRAFACGVFASWVMMSFVDICNMMGITRFSLEVYLGSMIRATNADTPRSWLVGCLVNWLVGGLAGIVYAYLFEYLFRNASARAGVFAGLIHSAFAALVIFPFFNALRQQMSVVLPYSDSFGILGSGIGVVTPLVLVIGHLIFGITVGAGYGPVRNQRIRAKTFEPGETVEKGDESGISESEDSRDRRFYGYGS
jgi:hypothetical protein